jgi:hypothetical protein
LYAFGLLETMIAYAISSKKKKKKEHKPRLEKAIKVRRIYYKISQRFKVEITHLLFPIT